MEIGCDNVHQEVVLEILDKMRFIRKEEIESEYIPNHCGLGIVDIFYV